MNRLAMLCIAAVSVSLVSCGDDDRHKTSYRERDRDRGPDVVVVEREVDRDRDRDRRHDRDGDWKLIARGEVGYTVDRDRFNVKGQGRYSELKLSVQGAPVEIYEIQVVFTNGDKWTAPFHYVFDRGEQSRAINIPDKGRSIDRVYFTYQAVYKKEGRAILALYGR